MIDPPGYLGEILGGRLAALLGGEVDWAT